MDIQNYRQRNVLIIGLGISGRAAARYLLRRGATVSGSDQNLNLLETSEEIRDLRRLGLNVQCEHRWQSDDMLAFDLVVVSPGVPSTNRLYTFAKDRSIEIIGEVELACREMKHRCLAVTGSNGKTTTTLMIEHVLNHSGIGARAVGNVGIPLTDVVDAPESKDNILVLELSSWQLETLSSRVIDAGAILNITPNHLDRHGSMEAYAKAKFHLRDLLKPNGKLYVGSECCKAFYHTGAKEKIFTFGFERGADLFCDQKQVTMHENVAFMLPSQYRGKHSIDLENMMAAYALCQEAGVNDGAQFIAAMSSFKKPPHRLEFIGRYKGVSYYNDSKATSLDAVAKAVYSLDGAIYLIAGGVHKGASYSPWCEVFQGKVKQVYAIGEAAELIHRDIGVQFPVEVMPGLDAAVKKAMELACAGEIVLLSPGCASYDMFKNYMHRGDEFKRIVQNGMIEGNNND